MRTLLLNVLRCAVLAAQIGYAEARIVNNTDPGCSDVVGTPFCTIQAAINAVPPDGNVNVVSATMNSFGSGPTALE